MKGLAFIDWLRASSEIGFHRVVLDQSDLLADAVEIADEAAGEMIETECMRVGDWWDTAYAINGLGGYNAVDECDPFHKALSYLDRRGLIERKPGEPHLIRFVEGV